MLRLDASRIAPLRCAILIVALGLLTPTSAAASCIGATTAEVAKALGVEPPGALVVASPLETDVAALPGHEADLPLRVAELVAGKIAGAHAQRTRRRSNRRGRWLPVRRSLVYVHVQLVKSELRVTVDAYPVIRNVWDRARMPPPPPTGHAYCRRSRRRGGAGVLSGAPSRAHTDSQGFARGRRGAGRRLR